jgi:hypothetical protein
MIEVSLVDLEQGFLPDAQNSAGQLCAILRSRSGSQPSGLRRYEDE